MAEEKKLLPLKEMLELMYGVKIDDPTPEELKNTRKWMEEFHKRSQEKQVQQTGQEDIL